MEDKILVTISGIDATIDLLNDRIRINRETSSTVETLLSAITSIKIEQGSLQIFTAAYSESIAFPATKEKVFELFKLELERVINAPNSSLKDLVMLEKMGELKDKGFITEDEFNAKKQQILGQGIDPINVEALKQAMESAVIAEEERTLRGIHNAEATKNRRAEEGRVAWRNAGIVFGGLWFIIAFFAFLSGCFVNGLFMLLTCLILTPLIHHLANGISRGKINHVSATVRVFLVLVTMILSTGSYYSYQSPEQLAAKAEAEQQRIDSEKMMQEQKKADEERLKAEEAAHKLAQKALDKQASAKIQKMQELGFLSKTDCWTNEAYINPDQWASIDVGTKENVTRIVMDYCSRHGGDGNTIKLRNEMDGKELGGIGVFMGFQVK